MITEATPTTDDGNARALILRAMQEDHAAIRAATPAAAWAHRKLAARLRALARRLTRRGRRDGHQ